MLHSMDKGGGEEVGDFSLGAYGRSSVRDETELTRDLAVVEWRKDKCAEHPKGGLNVTAARECVG